MLLSIIWADKNNAQSLLRSSNTNTTDNILWLHWFLFGILFHLHLGDSLGLCSKLAVLITGSVEATYLGFWLRVHRFVLNLIRFESITWKTRPRSSCPEELVGLVPPPLAREHFLQTLVMDFDHPRHDMCSLPVPAHFETTPWQQYFR